MSFVARSDHSPLAFGPTSIERLPRLFDAIGGSVDIWAKRDDCNSGLGMGGNKLRKPGYIVPDAIGSGADTLVSIGGVRSHHTRQVAADAARIGTKCVVVQEAWVPHQDGDRRSPKVRAYRTPTSAARRPSTVTAAHTAPAEPASAQTSPRLAPRAACSAGEPFLQPHQRSLKWN